DYAIQFQSRVHEARAAGAPDAASAIRTAAAAVGPTLLAAAAAGAGALLVMTLSPVPTVRGFALLLVGGIAIALLCAFTFGAAVLALADRRGRRGAAAAGVDGGLAGVDGGLAGGDGGLAQGHRGVTADGEDAAARGGDRGDRAVAYARPSAGARARAGVRLAGPRLAVSWRGAQELLRDNPLTRFASATALGYSVRNPGRVIGVGLALAALGWGLDTQTRVNTNLEKLVPQSMSSLRNLDALERVSGVGGEIDLMVSGADVATPKTIEWMSAYQKAVLARFGYSSTRGCGAARLCPAFSLPTLFEGGALGTATGEPRPSSSKSPGSANTGKPLLTAAEVNALLHAIPPYLSQNAITADRRHATLAFGIRLMPLDEQQRVIEAMRAALHPPRGVSVQLVGLPVLAAQSGALVASPWRRALMLLAGIAAAALVLLIAFRGNRRRALAPLLPVLLATGWSGLVVFVIRVPLNPMSVTLSALVIAISTEFSVLLSERLRAELADSGMGAQRVSPESVAGVPLAQALRHTYARTGAAVAASGVTAIAGFGVLVLSEIAMLREFGVVTLVDLSVSLLGVFVALPAALVLAEPGELARRVRPPRLVGRRRPGHEPA
ncbi:MAG TPA: MMPL family transporter, partial [Solirubrobacteraceae bacterium]|nr:MMPL family transporter [Solirubrobacteraceae bacterium]